jgi:hypothetical protein
LHELTLATTVKDSTTMTEDSKNSLIRFAIYFIIGVFVFVITIEGSLGLIPYGLLVVGGITFVFGAIARLLRGTWRYKRLLSISKVILFIGLINLILFFVVTRTQGKITKDNAEILIQKIELYKVDNGNYPRHLELLKPNYLDKIPKSWIGLVPKEFIYDYSDQVDYRFSHFKPINQEGEYHYWIGYFDYIGVQCFYNSKTKDWNIDD